LFIVPCSSFFVHLSSFIVPRSPFLVFPYCSLLFLTGPCCSFCPSSSFLVHWPSIIVPRFVLFFLAAPCCSLLFFCGPGCFFCSSFLVLPCSSLMLLVVPYYFLLVLAVSLVPRSSFIVPRASFQLMGKGVKNGPKKCPRRLRTAPSHVLKAWIASCTHIFIAISCPPFLKPVHINANINYAKVALALTWLVLLQTA